MPLEKYDKSKWGKPWIGRVDTWRGRYRVINWGKWDGTPEVGGTLTVEASYGDIVMAGQRRKRNREESAVNYFIVTADGNLFEVDKDEARATFNEVQRRRNTEN